MRWPDDRKKNVENSAMNRPSASRVAVEATPSAPDSRALWLCRAAFSARVTRSDSTVEDRCSRLSASRRCRSDRPATAWSRRSGKPLAACCPTSANSPATSTSSSSIAARAASPAGTWRRTSRSTKGRSSAARSSATRTGTRIPENSASSRPSARTPTATTSSRRVHSDATRTTGATDEPLAALAEAGGAGTTGGRIGGAETAGGVGSRWTGRGELTRAVCPSRSRRVPQRPRGLDLAPGPGGTAGSASLGRVARVTTPARLQDRVLTVPNGLSLLRLLGVPLFLYWTLHTHQDGRAVLLLMAAGASDYADGKIARAWDQSSRLGQLLDPLADRLYILATLVALVARDGLPLAFAVAIVGRDALLACALPALRRAGYGPLPVSFLGKAATFNLLYAFPMLLAALPEHDGLLATVVRPLGWAFAVWGTVLYWAAGAAYLIQVRQLTRPGVQEA